MATIKEDYVSFETAKLLKEMEFNIETIKYWENEGGTTTIPSICELSEPYSNSYLGTHEYSCPSQSMAMKWLREVHNIDIFPWKIGKGIYSCAIFNSNTGQDLSSDKDFPSEKYEEAAEAAVKYCLENLI